MASRILSVALCGAAIVAAHAACAAPVTDAQKAELLAAQNKYRLEVGEPPLVWSDRIALSAQTWAEHLANVVHAMVHSGAIATGENLATWPAGHATLTRLVKIWGDEKQYFVDSAFPAISNTGDWKTVGHYSQLVWKNTTEVGCGLATGGGQDYLVCQYNPQGNMANEKAF
jgi:hypothetical protein